MSYQPYHRTSRAPLATEVDVARMHAKLQAKLALAAKSAEIPQKDALETAERPVSRPPLEWLDPEPGKRGYYDTGRRYSVCDVTISGVTYWETWKLAGGGAWFRQLAVGLRSDAAARAAAQTDNERKV